MLLLVIAEKISPFIKQKIRRLVNKKTNKIYFDLYNVTELPKTDGKKSLSLYFNSYLLGKSENF